MTIEGFFIDHYVRYAKQLIAKSTKLIATKP